MNNKIAPDGDCPCDVCEWARRRIERERRLDEDLEANYQRYLAGNLVSKGDAE